MFLARKSDTHCTLHFYFKSSNVVFTLVFYFEPIKGGCAFDSGEC